MNKNITLMLCSILVVAGVLPVQAEATIVDIVWTATGHFTNESEVPPGKFLEVCGVLPAEQKILWSFDANEPTDFNIHYHHGKNIVSPTEKLQVNHATETLQTKLEQDYCWMWSNKTARKVTIKLNLQR